MKDPGIKTKVVHSRTKSAWNVVGVTLGAKYKIAVIPYVCQCSEEVTGKLRKQALEHAEFISQCFNNADIVVPILSK